VSEEGAIVNIDLYGNRVSAISFGPEKVYLVIGRNKLCTDLEKAIHRARNYASPMNAIRFGKNTPCTKTGQCSDCSSEDRICGTVSIVEWCAIKSRIHLLFVNEDLGF
ncbi:MAG: LUD domain-containing protein, partial [Spirochaetota bacterium]